MTLKTWIKSLLLAGVAMPCLALSLTAVPAAAQSDQWNALYDRLIRLEAEVHARDTATSQPGAMQGNDAARLNGIEQQLRQLVSLVQQMQDKQARLEFRLQQIEQRYGQQGAIAPQPSQQQWAQQQVEIPQQQADSTNRQNKTTATLQSGVDLSQYQTQQLSELAGQQPVYQNQGSQLQGQGPQVLGQLALKGEETQQPFNTQPQNQQLFTTQMQNQQQPFVTQPQDQSSFSTQTQDQTQINETPGLIPDKVETASLDGNQMTGSALANQIYQGAYQSLLSRQFGTAEAGFRTFLSKYPTHKLAGDAYYWLGETYFAQSDYKQAAQNFLQGYRSYPAGERAPDSLLKLGMSLSRLGQKPKACGAYAEVTKKYATAAAVRNKALLEMKRAGC
jgi:tol-pal system protein YbgF